MSEQPRSVLVASPSRLFAEAAAAYFERREGWAAAGIVTDGLEAVAAIARSRPDALLVTPGLARMGAGALAQQVRRRWPDVSVVVLGDPSAPGLPPDASPGDVLDALASPSVVDAAGPAEPEPPDGLALLASLTRRERAVMKMLAEGRSQSEMANALKVSDHTVRTHMQNLYAKLGCHSRLDVVRFAVRHGVIAEESSEAG